MKIAPLTVVYGPNGSGKSSLIYGLLTLRNFFSNPNRNLPSLFSYPTISLGGFNEVVTGHDDDSKIAISLNTSCDQFSSSVVLSIETSGGHSGISFFNPKDVGTPVAMDVSVPFPYRGDQQTSATPLAYARDTEGWSPITEVDLLWNGINVSLARDDHGLDTDAIADYLTVANAPVELARGTGFAPLRRGFVAPLYGVSNVTPQLATEDEVASALAVDRFLEYDVSSFMENIADRQIRPRMTVGTSSFHIDTVPRNGDVAVSIVNDGFGVNQLAYMLTICLYSKYRIIAIEEPEIHLHPSMVRKLAQAMVHITSTKDRKILISTHSESLVLALLAQIAAGNLKVDDVSFVLATKEDGQSKFAEMKTTRDGQIEGGLSSFMADELEDMALLFNQGS